MKRALLCLGVAAAHFMLTAIVWGLLFSRAFNQVKRTFFDDALASAMLILEFPFGSTSGPTGRAAWIANAILWAVVLVYGGWFVIKRLRQSRVAA